jgi:hypothetical protein
MNMKDNEILNLREIFVGSFILESARIKKNKRKRHPLITRKNRTEQYFATRLLSHFVILKLLCRKTSWIKCGDTSLRNNGLVTESSDRKDNWLKPSCFLIYDVAVKRWRELNEVSFICYGQTECYERIASILHVLLTLTILLSEYLYLQPTGGDDSRLYDPGLLLPITPMEAAAWRRSQYGWLKR